jgi:glycosyltransferase involved in cell wall biosynthesis
MTYMKHIVQKNTIDLTLFVPCFNEEENIVATLDTIREAMPELKDIDYEVLVTDDGSHDRTSILVKEQIALHPEFPIFLHRNPNNLGLSHSFVDAAFRGKGKYFFLVWGDNVTPKENLFSMLSLLGRADIIIPYFPKVIGKSAYRMGISNLYTWIVNTLSGNSIKYYNGSALFERYHVMRWAPNGTGFSGFLAFLITQLLSMNATYMEIALIGKHTQKIKKNSPLTIRNWFSTLHTLSEILIRRLSLIFQEPHKKPKLH